MRPDAALNEKLPALVGEKNVTKAILGADDEPVTDREKPASRDTRTPVSLIKVDFQAHATFGGEKSLPQFKLLNLVSESVLFDWNKFVAPALKAKAVLDMLEVAPLLYGREYFLRTVEGDL
ncbi:MAG: hypothetical protein R3C68_12395 [Myxococcota bacterium]